MWICNFLSDCFVDPLFCRSLLCFVGSVGHSVRLSIIVIEASSLVFFVSFLLLWFSLKDETVTPT